MKTTILAGLAFCVGLSNSFAGQPDPRFDGKWAGTETIIGYNVREQLGREQKPGQVPALIAIADSGKMVEILQGLTPGRYEVSPKSDGNTLVFDVPARQGRGAGLSIGRTDGKLVLSSDGNTLTETGMRFFPERATLLIALSPGRFIGNQRSRSSFATQTSHLHRIITLFILNLKYSIKERQKNH